MPSLPQHVLHAKLQAALPVGTTFSTGTATHPATADIPGFGVVKFYLWTVTHVESADRPPDEFKIQLILPGQARNERGHLEIGDTETTVLLGYSPDFGVFVGWEARLHRDFAFSKTVQVKEALLEGARRSGWAVAPPRRLHGGDEEVRVAFVPGNLQEYITLTKEADLQGKTGIAREAAMLLHTADVPEIDAQQDIDSRRRIVKRVRRKLLVQRFERDARFGPLVKQQYEYSCALCGTQLEIVEGAHIIPISVEDSEDEIWNGIAFCPNHHKLFDATAFIIRPDLQVAIDEAAVDFFTQSGRIGGLESVLTRFHLATLRTPLFFDVDEELRRKMLGALQWREGIAAIA